MRPALRQVLMTPSRAGGFRPTRYVSASASNGYNVGANSGAGGSKSAPWLTLDFALSNSVDGDVICLNDGTYRSSGTYTVGKSLVIVAQNRRQTVLKAAAGGQAFVAHVTAATDIKVVFSGLVFDSESSALRSVRTGSSALTSYLDVSFLDCNFKDATTQPVHSNGQKKLNWTFEGCEASGTWSGTELFYAFGHEQGSINVNGLAINGTMTAAASVKAGVIVIGGAATSQVSIRGVTGTITAGSATGVLYGVRIQDVDNAVIANNNVVLSGLGLGCLYNICCGSASLTANSGVIRDNRGHNGCDGGYGALYGSDSSGVGNNRQNSGSITSNVLTANSAASTVIHGLMLGFGTGGTVSGNTITGAALATIAKQQVGGTFSGNTINECNSQAIRLKGATDTVFSNNTVNLSASFAGDVVTVDANTSPSTNSTGIQITGNTFHVAAAPAKVVTVAASNTATFTDNLYDVTTVLGANPWSYQGASYASLVDWKAAIEPTARP